MLGHRPFQVLLMDLFTGFAAIYSSKPGVSQVFSTCGKRISEPEIKSHPKRLAEMCTAGEMS